jgi:hypothetical protein
MVEEVTTLSTDSLPSKNVSDSSSICISAYHQCSSLFWSEDKSKIPATPCLRSKPASSSIKFLSRYRTTSSSNNHFQRRCM